MEDKQCAYCDRKRSDGYDVGYHNQTGLFMCKKHKNQIYKHGKILEKTIYDKNDINIYDHYAELIIRDKRGNIIAQAIIDKEDVDKIKHLKWGLKNNGKINNYVEHRTRTYSVCLHRYLTSAKKNDIVDHINRNTLDNRKENLRIVTYKENARNTSLKKGNTSGYVGVGWSKYYQKWRARITVDRQEKHLGLFDNIEEAIIVRLKAELKYFGKDFAPQRHLFEEYKIG